MKACTSWAWALVAVRPVPMAQTGSYATVTWANSSLLRWNSPSVSCLPMKSNVSSASRVSSDSPTQKMGFRPAASAAFSFWLSNSSSSRKYCRRSEWPKITYSQPTEASSLADTSPVKAPLSFWWQFWAPRWNLPPCGNACPTPCKSGNGGQITISGEAAPAVAALARVVISLTKARASG